MLGPQTLGDLWVFEKHKRIECWALGVFWASIAGFRGLLDVWESRGILNMGSQRNLDFKGSGSGVCGCSGS